MSRQFLLSVSLDKSKIIEIQKILRDIASKLVLMNCSNSDGMSRPETKCGGCGRFRSARHRGESASINVVDSALPPMFHTNIELNSPDSHFITYIVPLRFLEFPLQVMLLCLLLQACIQTIHVPSIYVIVDPKLNLASFEALSCFPCYCDEISGVMWTPD